MARYGQSLLQGWEAGLDTSTELLSSEILMSPPVYSCPVLGETLEKSVFLLEVFIVCKSGWGICFPAFTSLESFGDRKIHWDEFSRNYALAVNMAKHGGPATVLVWHLPDTAVTRF